MEGRRPWCRRTTSSTRQALRQVCRRPAGIPRIFFFSNRLLTKGTARIAPLKTSPKFVDSRGQLRTGSMRRQGWSRSRSRERHERRWRPPPREESRWGYRRSRSRSRERYDVEPRRWRPSSDAWHRDGRRDDRRDRWCDDRRDGRRDDRRDGRRDDRSFRDGPRRVEQRGGDRGAGRTGGAASRADIERNRRITGARSARDIHRIVASEQLNFVNVATAVSRLAKFGAVDDDAPWSRLRELVTTHCRAFRSREASNVLHGLRSWPRAGSRRRWCRSRRWTRRRRARRR